MASNPLAVLSAMLGGGFTGYAKDEAFREDKRRSAVAEALDQSRFDEQVRQFNERLGTDRQQFSDRFGMDKGQFDQRMTYDWARLGMDERQNERNNQTQRDIANIYAGRGSNEEKPSERAARGLSFLEGWFAGARNGDADSLRRLNSVAALQREGMSREEAAFRVAQRESAPGGADWILRSKPDGTAGADSLVKRYGGLGGDDTGGQATTARTPPVTPDPTRVAPQQDAAPTDPRTVLYQNLRRRGMPEQAAIAEVNRRYPTTP